ncbi:protein-tyrosine-phosphatase [Empedobacter falsenii]|uniref:Protein-tyrosine-phosphatase n=1 Tax=Empedobacter falsenii TaxID=343874 RepID=A0A3R8SND5_9FLAO|nr:MULTISPECIES: protein-tyrosine-phosphatase [Empedobacter]MBY0067232.1 protein-tyrosine-phosphatase [Empedobacter falsenii]MDH0674864.1 protein-tyrosine-phosphatase [Empedobacter sp. GD03861]RRT93717.1 protein-tyrosine-phosphatase [Empedobacter falsenii]RRT93872.1 protein-tyrosine-phosphatase [Empedobacter falsenii]
MYSILKENIIKFQNFDRISTDRKAVLQPLVDYIQQKINDNQAVNLNFICTHNSRRSHFSQVWAQVSASFYNIQNVYCYSGGTEETALFPKVVETLRNQGFTIFKIEESTNPIYSIKFDENTLPIIGFSKKYDHPFNPRTFAAIMTCSQADGDCPFIAGAEKRIPITFEDPKVSDHTAEQSKVYAERSLQIATEMFYVFSRVISPDNRFLPASKNSLFHL